MNFPIVLFGSMQNYPRRWRTPVFQFLKQRLGWPSVRSAVDYLQQQGVGLHYPSGSFQLCRSEMLRTPEVDGLSMLLGTLFLKATFLALFIKLHLVHSTHIECGRSWQKNMVEQTRQSHHRDVLKTTLL